MLNKGDKGTGGRGVFFKKKGFTLLELLVGIFILIVGVAGIHGFVSRFFVFNNFLSSKMTAAYLSQEGIEITRNIRDTNWIEGGSWTDGLFCCASPDSGCECEADYNSSELSAAVSDRDLEIDSDGFFSYSTSGTSTDFERIIKVKRISNEQIEVCVVTQWGKETSVYQVETCDYLYGWYAATP